MNRRTTPYFNLLFEKREAWLALCAEYGNACVCCGQTGVELTHDHIIPRVLGGEDRIDNFQPLCRSCNSRKGDKAIDYRPFPSRVKEYPLATRRFVRLKVREIAEKRGLESPARLQERLYRTGYVCPPRVAKRLWGGDAIPPLTILDAVCTVLECHFSDLYLRASVQS